MILEVLVADGFGQFLLDADEVVAAFAQYLHLTEKLLV